MVFVITQLIGFGSEASESAPTDVYLLEDGFNILLETGDAILIEEG